jgi:hypothetical protein
MGQFQSLGFGLDLEADPETSENRRVCAYEKQGGFDPAQQECTFSGTQKGRQGTHKGRLARHNPAPVLAN